MAYVRKNWLNKNSDGTIPNGAIPVSADNLNRIEDGIEEALNRVKIGNFTISDGRCEVKLGFKPRYLTVVSDDGDIEFSVFQNKTNHLCELTEEGFIAGVVDVIGSNLSKYFTIANSSYHFYYDSKTNQFIPNNKGVNGANARTTLLAKYNMNIEFIYGYSCETADKFYLIIQDENGNPIQTIVNGAGGTLENKIYQGTLKAGQSIVFRYEKDGSVHNGLDYGYFKNMAVSLKSSSWSYMAIK